MGIGAAVTGNARGGETQKGLVKGAVLLLELSDIRSDNAIGLVAGRARCTKVGALEVKTRGAMIECSRIEADDVEIATGVFFVAGGARWLIKSGVQALSIRQPPTQGHMAGETPVVCDTAPPEGMALPATTDALEIGVGRRQSAGRDELCGHSRGYRHCTDHNHEQGRAGDHGLLSGGSGLTGQSVTPGGSGFHQNGHP